MKPPVIESASRITIKNLMRQSDSLIDMAIMATIAYSHALGWAFNTWELYKSLLNPLLFKTLSLPLPSVTYCGLLKRLDSLEERRLLLYRAGIWLLPTENILFNNLMQRRKLNDRKWRTILRYSNYWRWIPFLKDIFISGSVAVGNVHEKSDLDLLLFVEKKRIWTARFFTLVVFSLLGVRRTPTKISNRLCFNHFLADPCLPSSVDNLYNAFTYSRLMHLYHRRKGGPSPNGAYFLDSFWQSNQWIAKYFLPAAGPHRQISIPSRIISLPGGFILGLERLLKARLGDRLEELLKWLQNKKRHRHPLWLADSGRVVVSDRELAFHPASKAPRVLELHKKIYRNILAEL